MATVPVVCLGCLCGIMKHDMALAEPFSARETLLHAYVLYVNSSDSCTHAQGFLLFSSFSLWPLVGREETDKIQNTIHVHRGLAAW